VLCDFGFSEGELEEVLTTYTKINKSASIFLGSKTSAENQNAHVPTTGNTLPCVVVFRPNTAVLSVKIHSDQILFIENLTFNFVSYFNWKKICIFNVIFGIYFMKHIGT